MINIEKLGGMVVASIEPSTSVFSSKLFAKEIIL